MEPQPDRELSNEQDMEQSAITRETDDELESLKIDGTSENPKSDHVEKHKNEEHGTNSIQNPPLLQNTNCRVCLALEEESGEDPIIQLGCQCKDDISFGHESCLKKWFVQQLLRSGVLDCEICRSPLGARLEAIVRDNAREVTTVQMLCVNPRLLLLLQVPPDELDRLQIPHDLPSFYSLPPDTRRAIEASLDRQEQLHRRNQNRRHANFMMALDLATRGEGPLRADQLQIRILRASQLREQFILGRRTYRITHDHNNEDRDTNDDSSVDQDIDDDNSVDRAVDDDYNEDQNTNDNNSIDEDVDDDDNEDRNTNDNNSVDEDIDDDNNEVRARVRDTPNGLANGIRNIGHIPRVAIEGPSTSQQVEELLNELSLHIDMFANIAQDIREGIEFLPRSMFSQLTSRLNAPAPRSLTEPTTLVPRQYTYGWFQVAQYYLT